MATFAIEHHAVLYGLIAREAIQSSITARCTLAKATSIYGAERGHRMAAYAQAENIERTMPAYALFKEWRPPQEGQMVTEEAVRSPQFATTVRRCEWYETWKKYGLLEYGNMYCRYVDKQLVKGFNPELELDIPALLSLGDPCCIFNWGYERTPEIEEELARQQAAVGCKYVRDFLYHTAHLYCAMSRVFAEDLGEEGRGIIDRAMEQFDSLFGMEYRSAIKQSAEENGWTYYGLK